MAGPPSGPLLSVRTAVVLLLAVVAGVLAGVLGYLSERNLPSAVLVGGGAAAGALLLFHTLLGSGDLSDERRP